MMRETRDDVVGQKLPGLRLSAGALDLRKGLRRSFQQINGLAVKASSVRQRISLRAFGETAQAIDQDERSPWFWRSFAILVLIPVLASFIYFKFIASDQFISEMRFAVRGATELLPGSDTLAASGLGTLAALNANQDLFIIADYINSQSMIDDLSKEIDLRAIFSSPEADFLARFNPSQSSEELLRYWRNAVDASVEVASGILTVKVRTFGRPDSVRLAAAIRARCDVVVNQLLERMRHDMIDRGENEVKIARDGVAAQRASLEQFRNARMLIDPLASAQSLNGTVTDLRDDLIQIEVRLASTRSSLSANSLQIKILEGERRKLADQIAALEGKITSTNLDSSTVSKALVEYDRLDVKKTLAEERAALAERLLDNARADAHRHHVYLVSIEDPTLPQRSLFPRRGHMILMISLGALCVWSVVTLTLGNIRDHAR
jgi:capsular polysaccharide transport system permease protein